MADFKVRSPLPIYVVRAKYLIGFLNTKEIQKRNFRKKCGKTNPQLRNAA